MENTVTINLEFLDKEINKIENSVRSDYKSNEDFKLHFKILEDYLIIKQIMYGLD